MNEIKFCPDCGSPMTEGDRFCGECGFDTRTLGGVGVEPQKEKRPPEPVMSPEPVMPKEQMVPRGLPNQNGGQPFAEGAKNKNALIIIISILVLIFAAGAGLFWWLSRGEEPTTKTSTGEKAAKQENGQPAAAPAPDLSRAATYLPKSGLKCSFFVNYPDGTSGNMERINAKVVPSETVQVSEVEINEEGGETYGYAFHYVERPDGTYYISDQTPMEIFPVLKNHLTVGQTWNYQDEFGQVVWEVAEMGVSLDLGFTTLHNCLLLQEDNQAVGLKTITYYAPGMGRVMVKSSVEGEDFIRLTAYSSMDEMQAAATVKKWATNYADIHDDRTQS